MGRSFGRSSMTTKKERNMGSPYSRAPHVEGAAPPKAHAPNAALLIDFDNVTMGMRSDLSKELKNLLQTDVIKGKVTFAGKVTRPSP